MKQIILLLLTTLILTSFRPDTREDLSWLNGNWAGVGFQPEAGNDTWTIKFFCNVDKEVFTIQYPSLNCQGFWKVLEKEKNRVVFQEQIAKGEHNCMLVGTVVITKVDDDHISYSFFETVDEKWVLNAFSTLTRVK